MLKYLKLNNTPWEFELDERVKNDGYRILGTKINLSYLASFP